MIEQHPEKGKEAREFLREIKAKLPPFLDSQTVIGDATLEEWRERIARYIEKLGEGQAN